LSLPLTPEILEAAYEFLRCTPPFKGWKLPQGEEVEFVVSRLQDREGDHTTYRGTSDHVIRVSSKRIGHTTSLVVVMAHEMIHAKQAVAKTFTANAEHNAEFRRLATNVCKLHGFDPKTFV
jgi:hypothetical protein